MKKFRKAVCVLFCGLFCLISFGFVGEQKNIIDNTIFSHAVLNDGTMVTETFAVNFKQIENMNEIVEGILLNRFKNELNLLINEINTKIETETDENKKQNIKNSVLGVAEKSDDIVYLKITYSNINSWNYFNNENEVEINKRLFSFDASSLGKVGGTTNLSGEKQYIGDYLKEIVFSVLDSYLVMDENATNLYSYTYITKMRRQHSSSSAISKFNDLYYHQWLLDENPTIKFWTTRPVYFSWYISAVIVGLVVILIVYLVAFAKRKNKDKKIKLDKGI